MDGRTAFPSDEPAVAAEVAGRTVRTRRFKCALVV
jgi:hypothetical protein